MIVYNVLVIYSTNIVELWTYLLRFNCSRRQRRTNQSVD